MERAARVHAAGVHAIRIPIAATLQALGRYWGRAHRPGVDDDLGWWACRRGGGAAG